MYVELPSDIKKKYENSMDYVQLLANLFGQKQAGRVWNQYMVDKLKEVRFQQALIFECVFYRDEVIFIVYLDDRLFFGSDTNTLMLIIKQLRESGINIKDQGHRADYVGVNIRRTCNGSYEFTQHALIDAIIDDINISNSYTKPVAAKVSLQLHAFRDSPNVMGTSTTAQPWGDLNFLGQTTRPDIYLWSIKLPSTLSIQEWNMVRQ
ncbi:hypothetical protein ACHAW6_009397 [Cyclotella cf. meneghiniana]